MIHISETLAGHFPESGLRASAERNLICSFPAPLIRTAADKLSLLE